MVAGAEGESGLDLDADAVGRNAATVVAAVDHEPSGGNRRQAGEALRHPVPRHDRSERQVLAHNVASDVAHQAPHRAGVGREIEVDLH